MKCTNMFNGRRERENVSFHSSNTHASSLSLFLCLKKRKKPTHVHAKKKKKNLADERAHTFPARGSQQALSDMRGIAGK